MLPGIPYMSVFLSVLFEHIDLENCMHLLLRKLAFDPLRTGSDRLVLMSETAAFQRRDISCSRGSRSFKNYFGKLLSYFVL
jgi:hypothetical protein